MGLSDGGLGENGVRCKMEKLSNRTDINSLNFGPTEWWRNGSPHAEDICVERTDIDCRVDCHRRACSKWICMDIVVERVLNAVAKRLGVDSESNVLSLAG